MFSFCNTLSLTLFLFEPESFIHLLEGSGINQFLVVKLSLAHDEALGCSRILWLYLV